MRPSAWLGVLVVGLGCGEASLEAADRSAVVGAIELEDVPENPGRLRFFLVRPPGLTAPTGLVVALHGCAQRAADFQQAGWDQAAARGGFLVLYPQTSASTGCFRWFEPGDTTPGRGELASLEAAIRLVVAKENVPPRQVFVTGLSAGAAMAAVVLSQRPSLVSAGALFAGVPAGCATSMAEGLRCQAGVDQSPEAWARGVRREGPLPRVQVWTGTRDTTVRPVMARELVEQWTAAHGLDARADRREATGLVASEEHQRDGGQVVVQLLEVDGLGHAVPVAAGRRCGRSAPFIADVDVCAAEHASRFFGLLPGVELDELPPFSPDAGVADAGPAQDGGVVEVDGGRACVEERALPWFHLVAGRGVRCGFFRTLVCGAGTGELLGPTSSALPVLASSVDGVAWRAGACME